MSLSKSAKGDTESETACSGSNPPSFSAVVFFERSAAMKQFATPAASGAAAPTDGSSVPVPNAVGGADKAAAETADAGNSAQATDSASAPSTSTPGAVAP